MMVLQVQCDLDEDTYILEKVDQSISNTLKFIMKYMDWI